MTRGLLLGEAVLLLCILRSQVARLEADNEALRQKLAQKESGRVKRGASKPINNKRKSRGQQTAAEAAAQNAAEREIESDIQAWVATDSKPQRGGEYFGPVQAEDVEQLRKGLGGSARVLGMDRCNEIQTTVPLPLSLHQVSLPARDPRDAGATCHWWGCFGTKPATWWNGWCTTRSRGSTTSTCTLSPSCCPFRCSLIFTSAFLYTSGTTTTLPLCNIRPPLHCRCCAWVSLSLPFRLARSSLPVSPIQPYIQRGRVTLYDWSDRPPPPVQQTAYNHFLVTHAPPDSHSHPNLFAYVTYTHNRRPTGEETQPGRPSWTWTSTFCPCR